MFEFDALTFALSPTAETAISPGTLKEVTSMLTLYPELAHWRPSAFFFAWGDYSQAIYALRWVEWMTGHRDEGFLAYCYVRQRWPSFDFGLAGLFDDDVQALAERQPWMPSPLPPKPEWVNV